jgi:hypothetical protein
MKIKYELITCKKSALILNLSSQNGSFENGKKDSGKKF